MDNPALARISVSMKHDADILIVGGGLNGPALALALSRAGLTSCVIDAAPQAVLAEAGFDGRSYALALGSVRLLRNLGLWGGLAERAQPMREIKVSDGRAGEGALSPFHLHFDSGEMEEGAMGQMVEDRHLRAALLSAIAADPRIETRYEARVVAQVTTNQSAQGELQAQRRNSFCASVANASAV